MNSTQLTEPVVLERSGSSQSLRQDEDQFSQQNEENPLEVRSNASALPSSPTPNYTVRHDPMERAHDAEEIHDEPPPPYEEPVPDAPQIAPVEYSCENSPQLVVAPQSDFPDPTPPPRNPARLRGGHSRQNSNSPAISPQSPEDANLFPPPLQLRRSSRPSTPRVASSDAPETAWSSKAREAGFEIQPPSPERRESNLSLPSITLVSSTETLRHTREPGKLTAYLIPFPKPRLQGVRAEDIPDRFLVYTPPPPPLSKPAPGEKESHWHKTQRKWQEDVRKATMSKASAATWKGIKAKATIAIGKGVSLTKTSNLEFLDRVSEGTISSTVEETAPSTELPTPPPSSPPTSTASALTVMGAGIDAPQRKDTNSSLSTPKPKKLEELTLVYPPSLPSSPEQIRSEFVNTLLRTREKSRRDAIVASTLFPFAAAVDASLMITFGGLMEVSAVWAHSSIRGAMTSKRMTKGLQLGEQPPEPEAHEVQGCTCGHHEEDFGKQRTVVKGKGKEKEKDRSITLRMQQSRRLEILRRYLELCCLKKDFSMFPQLDEVAGDVNEAAVLEAIGWQPTRREGRDLEVEDNKGKTETLTPEQDEQWQNRDAREDIKRIMKKGASEWVSWCKHFQKSPEAALKK